MGEKTGKTGMKLGLTAVLLGMMICIYILIIQTPGVNRAILIPRRNAEAENLVLQPGEEWRQPFFVYKSFDQVILFRDDTETEAVLEAELTRENALLFSGKIVFPRGEAEGNMAVPGENGTLTIRLRNGGSTPLTLQLVSRAGYNIGMNTASDDLLLRMEISQETDSAKWTYLAAVLLAAGLSLAVLWGGDAKWTRWKGMGFVLVVCVVYMLLFPAWNINDFTTHFDTAYSCVNTLLGIGTDEEGGLMVRADDRLYFDYVLRDKYQTHYQPTIRSYDDAVGFLFGRTENNELVPLGGYNHVHREYGFWNYLPYIPGILTARLLSLNLATAVFLARLCGLTLYAMGIWMALRKLPDGLILPVTLLSCVPVCAMNLTAISYDPPVYVLTLVFFACLLSLRENFRFRDAAVLALCSLGLGLVKRGAYSPMLLSLFLLFRRGDRRRSRLILISTAAAFAGLIYNYRGVFLGSSSLTTFSSAAWGTYDAKWALQHPGAYLVMMSRSYLRQSDKLASIVGRHLGWNQAAIPEAVCGLFYLLLGLTALMPAKEGQISRLLGRTERLWLWLPVAVMVVMLPTTVLSYTFLGMDTIDTVQGRYYLPMLVPVLILVHCNLREKISVKFRDGSVLLWGFGFLTLVSIYYIWLSFLRA